MFKDGARPHQMLAFGPYIVDWSYYKQRLSSAIQKIVIILAAMQTLIQIGCIRKFVKKRTSFINKN
ncbi:hypothetical protein AAHE18_05G192100 [Arachis hypogaea]